MTHFCLSLPSVTAHSIGLRPPSTARGSLPPPLCSAGVRRRQGQGPSPADAPRRSRRRRLHVPFRGAPLRRRPPPLRLLPRFRRGVSPRLRARARLAAALLRPPTARPRSGQRAQSGAGARVRHGTHGELSLPAFETRPLHASVQRAWHRSEAAQPSEAPARRSRP